MKCFTCDKILKFTEHRVVIAEYKNRTGVNSRFDLHEKCFRPILIAAKEYATKQKVKTNV
jgi:DNA-directed RNA polymerase subunit N (RpoN/RPB10)